MLDLRGRTAFITGGSSGIGLAIAQVLHEEGMRVAIGYQSEEHLNAALDQFAGEGENLLPIRLDVADRCSVSAAARQLFDRFGMLHILVANAGVSSAQPITECSYDEWDRMLAINLTGVFNCLRAFLPHMLAHGESGHVTATSSIFGLMTTASMGAYAASKFGVNALMETLAAELEGTALGVSVLCPGVVNSRIARSAERWLERSPIATEPEDIARALLRAVRTRDLFVATHAEFAAPIVLRHRAIEAAFVPEPGMSEARRALGERLTETSIYRGTVTSAS